MSYRYCDAVKLELCYPITRLLGKNIKQYGYYIALSFLVRFVLAVTLQARLFLYIPPALTFSDSTLCSYTLLLTFPAILTITAIVSVSNINLLALIRESTVFSGRKSRIFIYLLFR